MKLPIVGIYETWLDDDCYHFSDIAGYNCLHKPRVNCVGGGVSLYIGEHFNYKERPDLAYLLMEVLNLCLLKLTQCLSHSLHVPLESLY